jgi:hypothetical protein
MRNCFTESPAPARDERLFDFLLNRINTNMRKSGSHALLIADEGKNYDWMLRKMRRVNYIPSRYGAWYSGDFTKNIPIDRIIEDISYRDSARSLFIQAADFSLMRSFVLNVPSRQRRSGV